jgi:hypothetical protein
MALAGACTHLEQSRNGRGPGNPAIGQNPTPCISAASGAPIGTTSPGGTRSLVLPGQSTRPKWHDPGRQVECTPKLGKQEGPGDRMVNPDRLRFMTDRVGAKTVEVRSSNASAVSHPHQVARLVLAAAGSVRGAGQAWLRSWRVAEDMDRSLAASIRLIVVAASRLRNRLDRKMQVGKAAQVEPGVAGAAHQP